MKSRAFTLIELLVVVLIIGILAAVALPQYSKVVQRTRNVELKQLIRTVAEAEQVYYLANGKYAGNFNELDVDLPLAAPGGKDKACGGVVVKGTDSIRQGKDFQVLLNSTNLDSNTVVRAMYTSGTYKCCGFLYSLTEPHESIQCSVPESLDESVRKKFCEQIENGTYNRSSGGFERYNLP